MLSRCFGIASFVVLFGIAHSQSANTLPAQALDQPPVIDGVINAEEWQGAAVAEGLVDNETGAVAEEGGTFWLAHDKEFVYVAARLEDKFPDRIQATEYRTNVSLQGNDVIGFFLDTFANHAEGNMFRMNPRGATDISIAGGRAVKREWLGEIQSKGRITETGWEVEARIPWSIMKLPPEGKRDMIFMFVRYHARLQREYAWRFISGGRIENFGLWQGVDVPPPPPKTLKLLPYTYIGQDEEEFIFNSGLDLKAPLTDRIELVATINPDFRNVENDILSLDFSYFERLAGETRPFFLEGNDYFVTSFNAPIFASQRIDAFDVGLKAYGKLDDDTTFGFLDTTDLGEENALVFNAKRQMTDRSFVQFAASSYERGGLSNDVGFAQVWQRQGPHEFYAQHSYLKDSVLGGAQRNNVGTSYFEQGMWGGLEYSSVTENYVPRIGFAPQRGFHGWSGNIGAEKPAKGPLMEWGWGTFFTQWDDFDGGEFLHNYGANGSLTWKNGVDFDFGFEAPSFQGSNDTVYFANVEYPRGNAYRYIFLGYNWGEIGGNQLRQFSVNTRYRPVERLQMELGYQRQELGDTSDLAILSANYDLGDDRAISGRLVYRDDATNWYLSYRRSGGRGTEYYLILGDPNARTFQKSLILKVAMPFEVRF